MKPGSKVDLKGIDPGDTRPYKAAEEIQEKLGHKLEHIARMQERLYAEGKQALLVIFQGMDTSGKDGATKSVLREVNPQGVTVTPFKVPSKEELAHEFLWRVVQKVPPKGQIGIFNRSHYEEVLVVRVHDLVPESVWSARFDQINSFEKRL
ncbi:MAG TPA: polyphosphate kinase 2 family protein, partial [Candidatus Thermoplasmatota archaeon]|nr:polyphosphate kinase 2 family protein [Candidatus Thermoplasmatota archaeon]